MKWQGRPWWLQNFASLNCFLNLIKNETCNFNGLNCEVLVLSGFNKNCIVNAIHSILKIAKRHLLVWLSGRTSLGKTKTALFTTKIHRKNRSKNSTCWCGSAVEHHLGKVGVTGPIPVTSSIDDRKILSFLFFIRESDQGPRPVGPGPQQSCSRLAVRFALLLKTCYWQLFLTRRPVTSSIKQKSLKRR